MKVTKNTVYKPKVKICGMTRASDVEQAIELGVDAIGMILHAKSPRLINLEQAKGIRKVVPSSVKLIGVFVNAPVELVNQMSDDIGLDLVQLHGEETLEYTTKLKRPYVKALRAKSLDEVEKQVKHYDSACAILLDPYVKGKHGGTGKTLDLRLYPQTNVKVVLAGGLSPSNILDVVKAVQPYAVDLNSGVESEPGIKEIKLIQSALDLLANLA